MLAGSFKVSRGVRPWPGKDWDVFGFASLPLIGLLLVSSRN